ncbi:MAG: metalloregulator ArsR/SmtB family transcription factor [Bacilli bacterium]|nr:metalloregulator ArsR/SmtB family transcription factor [Bacilli bacterium]
MNQIVNICKALSDETRFLIVSKLKNVNELCACKLLEIVECNQSTLSHHMKILVDSGLVVARKEWKWVHYSLSKEKINELINFFK